VSLERKFEYSGFFPLFALATDVEDFSPRGKREESLLRKYVVF